MSIKKNVAWDFTGKFLAFFSRLIISIVLTRLLSPSEFGLFASVFVFANIFQGFVDIGFGAGLIQKKEVNNQDYSSIFWLCIIISFLLAFILLTFSPLIAEFYKKPSLTDLAQSLTLLVLFSGLRKIHEVRNRKRMNFKLISKLNISAAVIAGLVAIFYAVNSPTVWALIIYELTFSLMLTVGYWSFSRWKPKLYFNITNVKNLAGFTKNHFLTSIINLFFVRIDYIIIGRLFPSSILGNYQRAKSLNQYIKTFSSDSFSNVLFPVFSNIQFDYETTIKVFNRAVRLVSVFSVYLSCMLFLLSRESFLILFGKEWLISAKYFKLIAIVGYVAPISTIMVNLILGQGKSKLYLKVEILKRLIYIPTLILAYYQGITYFLISVIVFELIVLVLNTKIVSVVINLSIKNVFKLYLSNIVIGLILVLLINNIILLSDIYISFIVKSFLFSLAYIFLILKASGQNRNEIMNLWKGIKNGSLSKFSNRD